MKPFLSGRPQVAVTPLTSLAGSGLKAAAANSVPHAHGGGNSASPGAPQVECVREGDKIVRLIVTCSCGERTEIECLYPAG